MKAYSDDFRLRIIEMIQVNDLTQPEIAEHFRVSSNYSKTTSQAEMDKGLFQEPGAEGDELR